MATQTATAAASKVLILVGAGMAGSIVLRNGKLSDVIAQIQEVIKGVNDGETSSSGHYDTASLAAQIRHLAQEVRDLATSRPVTVITGNSNAGRNLASFILPAAAVGALGYCYMRLKGLTFSDVMFVTKRNMSNAVASVSKQLDQVSVALAATKRHLTQRLEIVDGKLDEQREMARVITNEVDDVKTDLSQIAFDIESIQSMISGLEGKMGLLENKQDVANAGIWYLCKSTEGIKDGINPEFFKEASERLKFAENKSIKGLEFFLEESKPEEVPDTTLNAKVRMSDEKPMKGALIKSTTLHRSSQFSLRKEGLGFVL